MTELTRQIKRASMSHSLMNGYSLLLQRLAEENDERIKLLERENNYLREELTESRRANEHLFTELKRYKSLLRAKLPERELMLIDEIMKLRDLAKYAILCSEGDVRCEACPYHDEVNSLMTCKIRADAIKLGVEL